MFSGVFSHSIIKIAQEKNLVTINFINIRDFGVDPHHIVDDKPYGGGAGMVMRVDVLEQALASARCKKTCDEEIVLLDPQGKKIDQKKAGDLATCEHLILLCARYEGVDERIRDFVDEEISIGDYVLSGGEIPAMVVTDAIIRLLPNVLGKDVSSDIESFQEFSLDGQDKKTKKLLEYPQYTRPESFKRRSVPQVLLSGNHKKIATWRKKKALEKTKKQRPDLLR